MAVPSTLLWKKAIQDLQVNAPFQKLRRNLLLLLQLLDPAVPAAGPLAAGDATTRRGAGKTTVILIDRSASMAARDVEKGKTAPRRGQAAGARSWSARWTANATVMVIAFDDSAETVQPFTSRRRSPQRRAIDSVQPTDRRSQLKLAYQLADAQINFNPEQLRPDARAAGRLRLFRRPGERRRASSRSAANVTYDKIGSDQSGNVAIVALQRQAELRAADRRCRSSPASPTSAPSRSSARCSSA